MVHGRMDAAALAAVRQSGYGTVEVWLAEPHVPWREPGACAAFGARLADHGLRAGSVHLPFYPSVPLLLEEGAPRGPIFSAVLDEVQTESPLTITVIEDIHGADESTLDLIKFLGRRLHT